MRAATTIAHSLNVVAAVAMSGAARDNNLPRDLPRRETQAPASSHSSVVAARGLAVAGAAVAVAAAASRFAERAAAPAARPTRTFAAR
jgi:hypothetical protein